MGNVEMRYELPLKLPLSLCYKLESCLAQNCGACLSRLTGRVMKLTEHDAPVPDVWYLEAESEEEVTMFILKWGVNQ
jgi:hypothetical protein